MSDRATRALQRQAASGDVEARVAHYRALLRRGADRTALAVLAYAGDKAARDVEGEGWGEICGCDGSEWEHPHNVHVDGLGPSDWLRGLERLVPEGSRLLARCATESAAVALCASRTCSSLDTDHMNAHRMVTDARRVIAGRSPAKIFARWLQPLRCPAGSGPEELAYSACLSIVHGFVLPGQSGARSFRAAVRKATSACGGESLVLAACRKAAIEWAEGVLCG